MLVPTVKMETAEIIRNSVTKGEWLVAINLKDAYFHVPIHPDSLHLLRFHVDKRMYQFKALPFSLATAPLEFTQIVKEAKLVFQSCGILVHQYLDEWLLRANTRHQCQRQTKELLQTTQELSFVINLEKSELKPTQKIDFLGYHFDLVQGKVFATEKKLKILQKSIQDMAISSQTTPRLLMSLIGVLASLEKTIPMGWLNMRPPSVVSQNKLAISPVTRPEDSGFKPLVKTISSGGKSKQCENRLSLTSRRAQYPYFHRCVKPGLRSPSRKHDSQWQLDKSRKNITYQCSRVTGSVSSLKKVSKHNSKQKNSGSN